MAQPLAISTILEETSKASKLEAKISFLKAHDSFALRTILQGCFHPQIVWLLPSGSPPYKPCELDQQEGVLYRDARILFHFVKGGNDTLTPSKREQMFIQLLERLDPKDAEMLVSIKDKIMPYKTVTENLVRKAFPGLLPEVPSQPGSQASSAE